MRAARRPLGFAPLVVVLLLVAGCKTAEQPQPPVSHAPSAQLDQAVRAIIDDFELASVAVGVVNDRKVMVTHAWGLADVARQVPATADTIYAIASCSKPIVGLAVASLLQASSATLDLDADVNRYLGWTPPLAHPDHPATPITLRHLVTHTSGIRANDPDAWYDTYPKPDPDVPLDTYLRAKLGAPGFFLPHAPGAAETYSNIGSAVAGLVVEKAADQDFAGYCVDALFTPLAMADTRWRFADFSPGQQARIATPHTADLTSLRHYGFNDYPSGLLRTTVGDFSALLVALMSGGDPILEPSSLTAFESVPLFIEQRRLAGEDVFGHDGAEAGVVSSFFYSHAGWGGVFFVNSDVEDDDDLDALTDALTDALLAEIARR